MAGSKSSRGTAFGGWSRRPAPHQEKSRIASSGFSCRFARDWKSHREVLLVSKTLVEDRVRLEAYAWRVYSAVRREFPSLAFSVDLFVNPCPEVEIRLGEPLRTAARYRWPVDQRTLDLVNAGDSPDIATLMQQIGNRLLREAPTGSEWSPLRR